MGLWVLAEACREREARRTKEKKTKASIFPCSTFRGRRRNGVAQNDTVLFSLFFLT
jgi:hypothetical protein